MFTWIRFLFITAGAIYRRYILSVLAFLSSPVYIVIATAKMIFLYISLRSNINNMA